MNKKPEYLDQIEKISKQIVKEPDNVSLYVKRANLYYDIQFDNLIEGTKPDFKKEYEKDKNKIYMLKPKTLEDIKYQTFFFYDHGEYKRAINGYTQLINKGIKHSIAYYQRGLCFFHLKEYLNVVKDLTDAEKLYQSEKDNDINEIDNIYAYRGLSHYFLEKYDKAYSDFSKLINKNTSKFKEIYIFKGKSITKKYQLPYYYAVSCYFIDKFEEALIYLNEVINNDPKNYEAIFYRSKTNKNLGLQDKAEKDEEILRKALRQNNDLYNEIGIIYYRMNEWEKAIECFRKVEYDLSMEAVRIIEKVSKYYLEKNDFKKAKDVCFNYLSALDQSWWQNGYPLHEHLQIISNRKNEFEILNAKIEERNKIIADLSHSIKNLIGSVIDPLENLKKEKRVKPIIIDNALRGSNLIREIVNAMNLSFKGSFDDFTYDAMNNSGKDSLNINYMIIESLKHSVMNMFDGKYFSNFMHKYFPVKENFIKAKEAWEAVSQSQDKKNIEGFLKNHFFDTKFSINKSEKYKMGNEKGSAIKLLILLQEIIFNAVKYSSFVRKDDRFLKIKFSTTDKEITINVENKYKPSVKTITTGLGHVIIENFANLLNTKPIIKRSNDIYSVTITFKNFWGV